MGVALGDGPLVGLEVFDLTSEGFSNLKASVRSWLFLQVLGLAVALLSNLDSDLAQLFQQSHSCSSLIAVELTLEVHNLHQAPFWGLWGIALPIWM